jgi:flagellar hook-length control protein FliK
MTTVATIQAIPAADPAAFTGPARSTDSSGQFATELNKTTQQMRERETDNSPRIRTPKSEVDQSATQNRVAEPTDSESIEASEDIENIEVTEDIDNIEGNEDSASTVVGLVVTAPVVTESVVTEPVVTESVVTEPVAALSTDLDLAVVESVVNAAIVTEAAVTESVTPELIEPVVIDPVVIDSGLKASSELQEGVTAAARVSTETPVSMVAGESATRATTNNAINSGVVTENVNLTQVESDEVVISAPAAGSINSLATQAPSSVIPNAGMAPASNEEIEALLTGNVAQVDSSVTDPQTEVTTTVPLPVDAEAGELPTGSQPTASTPSNSSAVNTVAASGATTSSDSDSLSDGTGNGGVADNEGSDPTGEPVAGVDRAGQLEGAIITRTQGADSRAGLDTPVSPIVTNQVAASSLSQVTLDPTTPIPSAEFRAPAPVATQMSAHLSTFKGLADGTYETTLRLYPEELGQVSVRIQVNGGTVSIHAYGASDIAVQALREAMPDLRQDLLQSGLDLIDSQVDQGSSFLGNDQEPSGAQVVESNNSDRSVNQRNGEVAEPDIDALTNIGLIQGGRVDVRV